MEALTACALFTFVVMVGARLGFDKCKSMSVLTSYPYLLTNIKRILHRDHGNLGKPQIKVLFLKLEKKTKMEILSSKGGDVRP